MQGNLDLGVTSVGLSMPSAFTVSGSPVTASGNISVAGAGTVSQYIRGDGSLADFPSISGGGSSVSYYLNGSVSQGTIGGIAYTEMNKVPILGAGTDFTINADGYIASFITDAGDPALLQIPAGNWNFETFLQASSAGGSPSFYIELYKVDSGGTATLIASNSASPELISLGTSIHAYFSALAVPITTLALTDRLAIRYYVVHSGRTITLHTENNTLCQIITTFTTGLTALNGLTAQVQNFATGTSGTDFGISSASTTHTFNLPTASAMNRGALSSADWTTFNGKQNALTNPVTGTGAAGQVPLWNGTSSQTNSIISQVDFSASPDVFINTSALRGVIIGNGISRITNMSLVVGGNMAIKENFGYYIERSGGVNSKVIDSTTGFLTNIYSPASTSGGINFLSANANPLFRIFANTGNVLIQNGGTFTDAGFRLDVNGTARVTGAITGTSTLTLGQTGTAGEVILNRSSNGAVVGGIRADGNGAEIGGSGYSSKILCSNGGARIQFFTTTERMRLEGGNLLINTTTDVASSKLTIESTTQGFLPPRMTSAQRTAIASPATGLIVYQTDGVEGLYLRTSTAWRAITMV
jgi:hypothetical protein